MYPLHTPRTEDVHKTSSWIVDKGGKNDMFSNNGAI